MKGFWISSEKVVKSRTSSNRKQSMPKVSVCPCGLEKTCEGPMMAVGGQGRMKILVLAEAPGAEEDRAYARDLKAKGPKAPGRQLIGQAGRRLAEQLELNGIDLYEDCWTYNAVNCRPPANATPTSYQIAACRPRVRQVIEQLKPRFILATGMTAVDSLISDRWFDDDGLGGLTRWRGWQAPDQDFKAWICPVWHPSYVLRCERGNNTPQVPLYFNRDIQQFANLVHENPEFPGIDLNGRVEILSSNEDIKRVLRMASKQTRPVFFDYETSGLKPHTPDHFIYSLSLCWNTDGCAYSFLMTPSIEEDCRQFLCSPAPKIAQNIKFEERWSRSILGTPVNNWVWDTLLASHVEDNRGGISGLKFQIYVKFGIVDYSKEISHYLKSTTEGDLSLNHIQEAPVEKLLEYGGLDSWLGLKLFETQKPHIENLELTSGVEFLLQGSQTLMDDEQNGMVLNLSYVQGEKEHIKRRVEFLRKRISDSKEGQIWKDRYGDATNWNSGPQLASILYENMGLTPKKTTAKGKPSVDEEALEETAQESQLVQDILRIRKLEKIRGTYLTGWERETGPDHILRPFYNLHIARTYRSSCSSPNMQNVPIRDKVAQKITRRAIYPRAGHVLVEADYSGIEVRTSACYHRDPNMITYIMDPSTDMHRDTAMECFLLDLEEVSKPARQGAKNQFVFAEFYGSYWRNTAVGLWKWAESCTTAQNVSLITHLKKKGIRSLGDPADRRPARGTFLYHIREVEERFWGERFRVYAQWKEEFWQQYLEQGEFYTLTGFRCTGPMARNDVVNYPIQGSAFHCLLRSKYNTKNWIASRGYENDILPCGQIHDSGLFSVNPKLLPEFAKAIHYVWGEQLRKEWPWIIVPLEVEVEATPVDGSWYEKAVYHGENM